MILSVMAVTDHEALMKVIPWILKFYGVSAIGCQALAGTNFQHCIIYMVDMGDS